MRSQRTFCRSTSARTGWPFNLINTRFGSSGSLIATWGVCFIIAFDLLLTSGCWSCISYDAVLIGSIFSLFLQFLYLCTTGPYHEHALSRIRLIRSCSNKVCLILYQSEFLVTEDAVDLAPAVAWRFCCSWPLSGLVCWVAYLERLLVVLVSLNGLLVYPVVVCSALVTRFAPSNCYYFLMM